MNNQSLKKLYNFPPMYTKQRNDQIIQTQKKKWCDLIFLYYQQNSIFQFKEGVLNDFFNNTEINRSVDESFQKEIIDTLVHEERLINILDMKPLLKENQKFLKYWNRYDSKVTNKTVYKFSEMLKYDETSSEKNEKIFDDKNTIEYKQYILPQPLSFYEDVFLKFLDMSMSDGNGIFTVYEMSGIDGLFNIKTENEAFLKNEELEENGVVEGRMDTQLTIYLLYKLLIEKAICYPIVEDDELVAIKKA